MTQFKRWGLVFLSAALPLLCNRPRGSNQLIHRRDSRLGNRSAERRIPGVRVTLTNTDTGTTKRKATTASDGTFRFPVGRAGNY